MFKLWIEYIIASLLDTYLNKNWSKLGVMSLLFILASSLLVKLDTPAGYSASAIFMVIALCMAVLALIGAVHEVISKISSNYNSFIKLYSLQNDKQKNDVIINDDQSSEDYTALNPIVAKRTGRIYIDPSENDFDREQFRRLVERSKNSAAKEKKSRQTDTPPQSTAWFD